jgi:peroxiredoxin
MKLQSLVCAVTLLFVSHAGLAQEPVKQTLPRVEQAFAAPDFTLTSESGKTYHLADFRGQVVLINFWATWCPPCRREMPSMDRMWKKIKGKGVQVFAINVGENADTIFEFLGSYPVNFPLLMDLDGSVIKRYPVTGLPTTYIVNPQGLVTHRAVGSREWDDPKLYEQLLAMRKH